MFDTRELATILAALLFWSEEISPSGNEAARHYLKSVKMIGIEPLIVLDNTNTFHAAASIARAEIKSLALK